MLHNKCSAKIKQNLNHCAKSILKIQLKIDKKQNCPVHDALNKTEITKKKENTKSHTYNELLRWKYCMSHSTASYDSRRRHQAIVACATDVALQAVKTVETCGHTGFTVTDDVVGVLLRPSGPKWLLLITRDRSSALLPAKKSPHPMQSDPKCPQQCSPLWEPTSSTTEPSVIGVSCHRLKSVSTRARRPAAHEHIPQCKGTTDVCPTAEFRKMRTSWWIRVRDISHCVSLPATSRPLHALHVLGTHLFQLASKVASTKHHQQH